jgi:hypothetical protein
LFKSPHLNNTCLKVSKINKDSKKILSYLASSQIWLILFMDDHKSTYFIKLEKIPWLSRCSPQLCFMLDIENQNFFFVWFYTYPTIMHVHILEETYNLITCFVILLCNCLNFFKKFKILLVFHKGMHNEHGKR